MAAPHVHRANRPHVVEYFLRLLGTGAADMTIQEGSFIKSVTRTGAGTYLITFQQDPGLFLNWTFGFGSVTMTDIKGYTVVRGVFTAATTTAQATLAFTTFNSSFAATDMAANQFLDLTLAFSEHGN